MFPFPSNYSHARAQFLTAAKERAAQMESWQHPLRGPSGEKLFIDVAYCGASDAPNVLAVFSGTHGIEGCCGSGVQVDLLRTLDALPVGCAVLCVHAVNPWGFAWDRRVNEEGVDVARNFVDFAQPLPENPRYNAALAAALVPRGRQGGLRQEADRVLEQFVQQHGVGGVKQVFARGQHEHPFAPFFGGTAPSWSNRQVRTVVRRWLVPRRRVIAIDYHTGLGANGTGQLIAPREIGNAEIARARQAWGQAFVQHEAPDSVSYYFAGSLPDMLPGELPGVELTRASYEFGTRDVPTVLEALREDHWLHCHGELHGDEAQEVRHRMRHAFFDESPAWRSSVLQQARWAHAQALAALTHHQEMQA